MIGKTKIIITGLVVLAALVVVTVPVFAQVDVFPDCGADASGSAVCANKETGGGLFAPGGIFSNIVQTVIYIVGALSVLMIIIGGLRYVLSGGDSSGVNDAKNTILYAVVGLVVAIAAQGILTFVLQRI